MAKAVVAKALNEKHIAKLKAAKAQGRYRDKEHRGLYLQIGPTGTASWLLRYEHNGKEHWHGLGSADDFSLKEARNRARAKRQLLADGIDPIEHRLAAKDAAAREARERRTFREASDEFLRLHAPTWKNDKHRHQWKSTLKEYAFPKLGERAVASIDAAIINEAVAPIWLKVPETARRTRGRIERIVQWVKDGMPLPTNSKNGNGKRNHPALPWQEIPAFMAELRQRESVSARALEFCVLTAARTGETIGAKWPEINLDEKVWIIPAARMKASREHRVPLSARAVEILQSLPRERGNDHVFIGGRKGEGLSNMAMLEMVRGLRSEITTHGFRSAFKDWSSEATATPNMVSEAALAHIVGDKVEAAYRRGDLFQKRRKLMTEWARYCASEPAEVVPLKKRRTA